MCFLQKSHISWKLHSRRPDGRAWESSELFLLKLFPLKGPEFKSKAFATNNWASVRGCGWQGSKASWDFEQLLMQIEGKRLIPGANVVTQKCSLWQQKKKGEVRLCAAGQSPGALERTRNFCEEVEASAESWGADKDFYFSCLGLNFNLKIGGWWWHVTVFRSIIQQGRTSGDLLHHCLLFSLETGSLIVNLERTIWGYASLGIHWSPLSSVLELQEGHLTFTWVWEI